ncbi:MAG: hypothetical protein JWR17_140 [Pseudomonas sp.]|jgi:hypothetical protein|nr:hypothetical protein [Pseudomonas sp.]
MKICLCLLLMLLSLIAKAEKPLLIPLNTPSPKYPEQLKHESVFGNVVVRISIQFDGVVVTAVTT